MAIKISFNQSENFIEQSSASDVTIDALISAFTEIDTFGATNSLKVLSDFSAANLLLSSHDILKIKPIANDYAERIGGVQVAIVVQSNQGRVLADLYSVYQVSQHMKVEVFDEVEKAKTWLGLISVG